MRSELKKNNLIKLLVICVICISALAGSCSKDESPEPVINYQHDPLITGVWLKLGLMGFHNETYYFYFYPNGDYKQFYTCSYVGHDPNESKYVKYERERGSWKTKTEKNSGYLMIEYRTVLSDDALGDKVYRDTVRYYRYKDERIKFVSGSFMDDASKRDDLWDLFS